MLRAAEIAAASSGKLKVINMLQLPGGNESQQVMLQVRFAEVNRSALKELGLNLFAEPRGLGRPHDDRTVRRARPSTTTRTTFSDFLNIFFFSKREGIGGVIKALQTQGLLPEPGRAEPDCLQRPGGQLPGGRRVPGPVRLGHRRAASSIQFKEFGVRLNFKPTIAGDVIRLHVQARSEHARFQQRRHDLRVPDSGARRRAARRPKSSCATASRLRLPAC